MRTFRQWLGLLAAAGTAFLLVLAMPATGKALPADAHETETWYSYKQDLSYDFTARVQQGAIYKADTVSPQELLQVKLPVDPPVTRRVLVSKLTDSIRLTFPYHFEADREAEIAVTYGVDATLTVPNLWTRPYPLLEPKSLTFKTDRVQIDEMTVEIPIKSILVELDQIGQSLKIGQDQAEVRVRPVVRVMVDGLREPVSTGLAPEVVINIRGANAAVEIDEPRVAHDEKIMSVSRYVPPTVMIGPWKVETALLRQLGLTAATIVATVIALIMVVGWLRRRSSATAAEDLKRLGASLVTARGLELPAGTILIDVWDVKQLIQVHLQTDRPVIKCTTHLYLVDGNTCYRMELPDPMERRA
jgi:hypothetical protein